MKKYAKALLLILCAVLLVAGSVLGTLAFLTSEDRVENTFSTGHVKITLDEAPVDKTGKAVTGDRVKKNDYHLLPGHEYVKDPTVHVVMDSEDCYVRMFVTVNQSSQWDAICDGHKDAQGKKQFDILDIFQGLSSDWTMLEPREDLAGTNTRTYEFRYKEKVTDVPETADKDLPALFTGLKMPDQLTNEDMEKLGDDFRIWVVAQAIQEDGFASAEEAFDPAVLALPSLMP